MCICGSNAPQFAHIFLAATGIGAAVTIANGQLTSRKQIFIYLHTKFLIFYKIDKIIWKLSHKHVFIQESWQINLTFQEQNWYSQQRIHLTSVAKR